MLKARSEWKIFSFSLDISVQSAFREGALLQRRVAHTHRHHFSKETALRTLQETGFEIALGPLLALISSEGETVVLAVYTGEIIAGHLHAGDDLIELGWFAPESLPELAFPHDLRIIEQITKMR